jgi:hypothetical protein
MGREVRMVPAGWEHPADEDGDSIPLFDGFNKALAQWDEANDAWERGERGWGEKEMRGTYAEYNGDRPVESDYVPDWPAEQRTHFQYYNTTSDGEPISPVFATLEELAEWFVENDSKIEPRGLRELAALRSRVGQAHRVGLEGAVTAKLYDARSTIEDGQLVLRVPLINVIRAHSNVDHSTRREHYELNLFNGQALIVDRATYDAVYEWMSRPIARKTAP